MQKVAVSAGNGTGVDTNEAAGMSSVISHPAGAIRPGAAPFSVLCYRSPPTIATLFAGPFASASDKRGTPKRADSSIITRRDRNYRGLPNADQTRVKSAKTTGRNE